MTEKPQCSLIQCLRTWCLAEFRRRTKALEEGTATMREQIDWAIPGYRLRFSEAQTKAEELGIDLNIVDLRVALEGCIDGPGN